MRLLLLPVLLMTGALALAASHSVTLHYQVVNNFPVKFVAINMTDPDVVVTPAIARPFPTGLESWNSFLQRLQPDAAINGTYFCLRSNMPVGDVAVDGAWLYRGVVGTALCITPDRRVVMRPGPRQAKPNWTGFRTVLCAGPRLLTAGQLTLNARAEGFRDPHVLGSAPRSAVAMRGDGLLLFLTIDENISLENLAYVCRHLGAVDAMALDGGTSSGLYAKGRTVTRPGRGLSNILVVYSSTQRYQQFGAQLIPRSLPVVANLLAPLVQPILEALPGSASSLRPDPFAPIVGPAPATTAPAPAKPVGGLVRFVTPKKQDALQGMVPVKVEIEKDPRVNWAMLRINGQLKAMTNIWPLEYRWDTTKEADGDYTLEVVGLGEDRALLSRDVCQVRVRNSEQVAAGR